MANRFRVNTTEFSDSSTINSGQLIDANGLLSLDWNTKTVLGVPNTKSITTSGYFNKYPDSASFTSKSILCSIFSF